MRFAATQGNLPPCPRNYLLRVFGGTGGLRFVVQDLRTGERRQFASEGELQRFLAVQGAPQRLR